MQVPWLVLCFLNPVYSLAWLAPRTPNCEAAYYGTTTNTTVGEGGFTFSWSHCETYWVLTNTTSLSQAITKT